MRRSRARGFCSRPKPAQKTAGLSPLNCTSDCRSRLRGQECPRHTLLVYPDGAGFFQLGMLLPEFAGYRAERNACGLREIRSRPFSLGGGVIRSADDALSRRHRRISCVFRMTRKLVALRLIADSWHAAVLRKRRGGGKQAEQEHGLFHCRVSRLRRKRGIIHEQRGGCWLLQSE